MADGAICGHVCMEGGGRGEEKKGVEEREGEGRKGGEGERRKGRWEKENEHGEVGGAP